MTNKGLTEFETEGKEARQALAAQKPVFVRAILFSGVIGFLMLSPSFYMLEVYDRVVNSRSYMTLLMLTLLLVLAYVTLESLQWARSKVLRQAAEGFDRLLAKRVYDAVFRAHLRGDRLSGRRRLQDFFTVREFFNNGLAAGILDIPMALMLIGVIFWIDRVLGVFALISALIQGIIALLNQRATGARLLKAHGFAGRAQGFVQTSLRNREVSYAMGMTENLRQRWLAPQSKALYYQSEASDRAGGYTSAAKYVQMGAGSLMLGLGSWLLIRGNLSSDMGWILMASILAGRALAPLTQVITGWRNVIQTREAFFRLENLLEKIPALKPGLPLPPPQGNLSLESVSAAAPGGDTPVLKNLSFTLPAGQWLAVIGPSAAGKSSLAHLLVGTWPCASGTVRLDGADVFVWDKQDLGRHIGFLPQHVALFEGTVAENIARFGTPDPERITTAAQLTGLDQVILTLPEGYDTKIEEAGSAISGGLRQRIGLARALYGNPKLVVLDEPDSHLDEAGTAALVQSLQAMRNSGTTLVTVTHHTNLLALADWILILAEGTIRRFGTREEVMAMLRQPKPSSATAEPEFPASRN